jgi:hypothetical protein
MVIASVKRRFPYLLAAAALTVILRVASDLSWTLSALIAFVGWPLVGTIVTLDDDLRGGWSNPDGKRRPDWLTSFYWGHMAVNVAICLLVHTFEVGIGTPHGLGFLLLSIITSTVGTLLIRAGPPPSPEDR